MCTLLLLCLSRTQENIFLNLFHSNGQTTFNSMKMPGIWADEIVVRAAATVFDRPVYIVSSLENENSDKQINARTAEENRRAPMLLGHVAENHY